MNFAFAVLLPTFLITLIAPIQADTPPEVITRGKQSTVLIEVKPSDDSGTAFSIGGGFLITNQHVVESVRPNSRVNAVINAGESNQKVVQAKVIRADKNLDLALLKIDPSAAPPALELGDSNTLVETIPVTAFGFPFGTDLSVGRERYPNITVTTGKVSSLRKAAGLLEQIQLDASLNPGNSGGPVINSKGQVVGIVEESILGTTLSFAIPVSKLKQFLARPEILFTPPTIDASRSTVPATFEFRIVSFLDNASDATASFSLSSEGREPRTVATNRVGDHYVATIAPLPSTASKGPLHLTVIDGGNTTELNVNDLLIKVGIKQVALGSVREIRTDSGISVTTNDGQVLHGPITGLNAVEGKINGVPATLNLSHAKSIVVEKPMDSPRSLDYVITVKRGGAVVGEATGIINLEGVTSRAHKGVLILGANIGTTADNAFDDAPPGSTERFIMNVADFFTGGKKGNFLLYSTAPHYGQRFKQSLTLHGHKLTQTLTPDSLSSYDGVFVGGNPEVKVGLLADYISHGGCVYVAGGSGGNETGIFNSFLMAYGLQFKPWPNDYNAFTVTEFAKSPLFEGIKGLHIHGYNAIVPLPGDFPHTKVLSSQNGTIYWAIYTADSVLADLGPVAPKETRAPVANNYVRNPANGHWYCSIVMDRPATWMEVRRFNAVRGHARTPCHHYLCGRERLRYQSFPRRRPEQLLVGRLS
jgi:hypothetical protein